MIIGIHGKAGSGKNTLAYILQEEYAKKGLKFEIIGFGDALKHLFCLRNHLTIEELEEHKPLYRTGLQQLGDELRKENPSFLTHTIHQRFDHSSKNFIVIDVRFENEYQLIDTVGVVFKIEASKAIRNQRRLIIKDDHPSETALDHYGYARFEHVFQNNGTIQELIEQVQTYLSITEPE